ncbi:MAG: efflux RND transporter periplasmic adaptor subunit [Pseudomonadota bacterium]
MPMWKQFTLTLMVCAAALAGWIAFVPAAMPMLASLGVLAPLERLGVIRATAGAETNASAAPSSAAASGGSRNGGSGNGGAGAAPVVQVVARLVETQALNDTIAAIGSARGARSVVLATEAAGQITALIPAPGQYVQAGAVVAELESVAARIAMDRTALVLADARATSDRVARLQASGTATDLQVREAELALATADLAYREAELDLSRRQVVAPIAGWIGILSVEVGDQVTSGQTITVLEDRSSLIVDFRVPERVVSRLKIGDAVTAMPLAEAGMTLPGTISALDNRVDVASRTLLVQAAIGNADDRLRAGMAFQISLEFTGASHPAVDPLAIQWGADGAFVWVLRDAKALRLPARILQRTAQTVLIDAAFAPGDLVVTEGVQALRPGIAAAAIGTTATTVAASAAPRI